MAMITDEQRHNNGFEDNGIECRPWSDLPVDILDIIARQLDIVERVSFRAACKNWREIQGLPLVKSPWIMGHCWVMDENVYSLCSFSLLTAKWSHVTRNKFEREGFRDLYGAAICASKHGWLLLQKSKLSFFYNPYTNSIIKLPDLNISFNRTTFSSVPSSPDCFCFAIQSSKDSIKIYIHVCQPGDHKWKTFESYGIGKAVEDVVYSNGTFYCVFSGGVLGAFDLAGCEWSFLNILSIPEASFWFRAHMIESHGQLWLVCPSNCFEVFKFNWLSQNWVKKRTLGCRALFLGCTSFLVSAEGETSSFADKIYYHSDSFSYYYSMETKQSYRCETTPTRWGTERIWIQPPEQSSELSRTIQKEMSFSCGVECVLLLGCTRWAWKRCTYVGSDDSATWTLATPEEFERVPRICRLILAVYEPDLRNPQFPPSGGYRLNPDWVVKRVTYEQTLGNAPPYLIYCDRDRREIVLAIRGLNLSKESDYKLLLDNRLGMQMFDGGYVHHGLLNSAIWILNQESDTLSRLWKETDCDYDLIFTGHSLGSGVAALLTVIVVNHRDRLAGIPRSKIRCYAVAPARCMSLNLAVKYADVIYSIVLQDDFLPRTATPLEDIFKSIFCLPCLLFLVCLRDTFIPEGRKLKDPRRLYAPGRMYHIVERKFCRCGRFPPEVRTAIPVEGRFEHIVLSCNATSDHGIVWIEREAEKALQRMRESIPQTVTTAPKIQKLERLQTIEKEHKDALERAVSLNVPHAVTAPEEEEVPSQDNEEAESSGSQNEDALKTKSKSTGEGTKWDEVVEKLFKKNESGEVELHPKREAHAPQ